jgi:hypothetical protein
MKGVFDGFLIPPVGVSGGGDEERSADTFRNGKGEADEDFLSKSSVLKEEEEMSPNDKGVAEDDLEVGIMLAFFLLAVRISFFPFFIFNRTSNARQSPPIIK